MNNWKGNKQLFKPWNYWCFLLVSSKIPAKSAKKKWFIELMHRLKIMKCKKCAQKEFKSKTCSNSRLYCRRNISTQVSVCWYHHYGSLQQDFYATTSHLHRIVPQQVMQLLLTHLGLLASHYLNQFPQIIRMEPDDQKNEKRKVLCKVYHLEW